MTEIPDSLKHLPEAQASAVMDAVQLGYEYHSINDDDDVILFQDDPLTDRRWWFAIDAHGEIDQTTRPDHQSLNTSADGLARNLERFKAEWPAFRGAILSTLRDLVTFRGGLKKFPSNLIDCLKEPMDASSYWFSHLLFFYLVGRGGWWLFERFFG